MTQYDFDIPIERHGTDSLKFDRAESRHRSPDLLSLWVADMDFQTPQEVIDALVSRSRHGIFGYTEPGTSYFDAVRGWLESQYGLVADEKDFIVTPGVVFALAACVRAFTQPGDAVLIQPPVYYPFSSVIIENDRKLAKAPLVYEEGGYRIDFDAFEHALVESGAKLFILCNPHNPVGRVWSVDELRRLAEICSAHDTLIVSDEIHMDFFRPGFTHTSLVTLADELKDTVVTCTSASKTFNLAGLQVANIIVYNEELRTGITSAISACGYSQVNTLGLVATQAAYEYGGEWLSQLKEYLEGNWALLEERLAATGGKLKLIQAESTYLAWIDCRELGLGPHELARFVEDEAGLWLDCGHIFGREGEGFIRINIATQRAYLERALDQLIGAL